MIYNQACNIKNYRYVWDISLFFFWVGSLWPSHHHEARRRDSSPMAHAGCLPPPEQSPPWVRCGHLPVSLFHCLHQQRRQFPGDSAQPLICELDPAGSGRLVGLPVIIDAGCWCHDYVCMPRRGPLSGAPLLAVLGPLLPTPF